MIALYIIGGILLFFTLIALIRVEAVIAYGDIFSLTVRIAGFPIRIIPAKEKKIRLRDYSPKALKKRQLKEEKKSRKAATKAAKKASKTKSENAPKKKKDIGKIIDLISGLLGVMLKRFGKHIRLRIAKLHVNVATGDAADTAILYGYVSQSAAYLLTLLDSFGTLRNTQATDVNIRADYLSEKTSCDIEIGISLCVWQVFDMVNHVGAKFIKQLIKTNGQLF